MAAGKPSVIVEHKDALPNPALNAVKPLYVRLTGRQLFEQCVRGATQNVNECYNGMLWRLCSKETFCGVETLQTAVHLATAIFNHGCETLVAVLDTMQCSHSFLTTAGLRRLDARRIYHSKRKSSYQEKKGRKRRRAVRKGLADTAAQKEGETYAAGAF